MSRFALASLVALVASCTSLGSGDGEPRVVHSVFFELRDPGDARSLAANCRRRLGDLPGIVSLAVGPRERSQERPTSDLRFDVGLTIVFEDVAALEAYLAHPTHLALVEDFAERIAGLRVFDTQVSD